MLFDFAATAKILEPHWPAIEQHFDVLNARFTALMRTEHEPIGRVLKSHLVIESFIDAFLMGCFRHSDIEGGRLSFHQKASLLPLNSGAGLVRPGILQLNRLRNKFSHRLDHVPTSEEISEIERVLTLARPSKEARTPIDAIEAFTPVACAFLDVPPEPLQEVFLQAFSSTLSKPANPAGSPRP
jgi:hypothetical protein